MKKHLPSAATLLALLLVLCLYALAQGASNPKQGSQMVLSTNVGYLFTHDHPAIDSPSHGAVLIPVSFDRSPVPSPASDVIVNGVSVGYHIPKASVEGTTYLGLSLVLRTLFPSAQITFEDGTLTAKGAGLSVQATEDKAYFSVNGRYFYVPSFVIVQDQDVLLPIHPMADALGCTVREDPEAQRIVFKQVAPPASPGTYVEEDLYWLSRAIYSESGNQPMKGRIAVGTVILNRVADERFPDTIKDVVFAPGQFSPVANGTIYREPDEESVIAAMLCLDGVREAEECLYFNVTSMRSWADKTRDYVCTIGGHNFYA